MSKHTYTVTINRVPSGRESIGYKFRSTACVLTASRDAASVQFQMGSEKTFDDLISFRVDLVKDAMRKMHLLHAMKYGARLRPRQIIVTIDGKSRTYDKTCPGFPFLYAMRIGKELDLPESWKDPEFLKSVLDRPKSKTDNDPRYACLFSFLAGTGKQFEIERFTCYWTAMNAHYNYLIQRYKDTHAAKLGLGSYEDIPKKKRPAWGDRPNISALLRVLGCGDSASSKDERTAHRAQYGAMKTHLRTIPREELPGLYRDLSAHRTDRAYASAGPLGDHLRQCITRANMSAYGFVLLDYAYYMRCNYLHGSKATILFTAANDPELAAFRTLNLFLGEYLKEAIPGMFREDWFTEEMYQAVQRGVK